ncbi:MAG: cupin domain-containing protein [Bacteroidota bacterium]
MRLPIQSNIFVAALIAMSLIGWSVASGQQEKKMLPDVDHPRHMLLTPADIEWVDGPASLPPGAKFAVIEGDLSKPEPITFRLKLPGDYKAAPHWHPGVEHVTVISGTLYLGAGDQLDPAKATELPAGSFAVFPVNRAMWGWTKGETVVQVHSIGPWGISYVNPADDPRKEAQ